MPDSIVVCMARKWSKRKRPDRELHRIREQEKTDTGIFNDRTMIYLSKFYNKGIIGRLAFILAKGKEADVYAAEPGDSDKLAGEDFVVVKFFRVDSPSFQRMKPYLEGDMRFGRKAASRRSVVKRWCMKEFGNLKIASEAGANVPKPYMVNGTILAMQFIGDGDGVPAPKLKDVTLEDPGAMLELIIGQMCLIHKARLVHADLSEFNILVKDSKPFIIDVGQAVLLTHPNARSFLERDVRNILAYFKHRYNIGPDASEVFDRITSKG